MNQSRYDDVVRRTLHGEQPEREEISLLEQQLDQLRKLRALDNAIIEQLQKIVAAQDDRLKMFRG